jgi:hypothetical protein
MSVLLESKIHENADFEPSKNRFGCPPLAIPVRNRTGEAGSYCLGFRDNGPYPNDGQEVAGAFEYY